MKLILENNAWKILVAVAKKYAAKIDSAFAQGKNIPLAKVEVRKLV